jgi:hypothetical protein
METGETGERKLLHADGEAERFYRQVAAPELIGREATGNSHWLMDLLSDLGYELWVGMRCRFGRCRPHGCHSSPVNVFPWMQLAVLIKIYGSNGNYIFEVPGCVGCGVHSGRKNRPDGRGRRGPKHATNGCIRTTDDATDTIQNLIDQGDPLRHLFVIR